MIISNAQPYESLRQLNIDHQLDVFLTDLIPFEGNSAISYSSLLPRYTNSSWGHTHSAQPLRYAEHFGYDRDQMLIDLGEDVDPIGHMRIVHNDMIGFGIDQVFNGQRLKDATVADIAAVRIASLLHDVGESSHTDFDLLCGGTIGDIPYGQKTSADRDTEKRIAEKIFATLFADIPEWLQARSLDIISHKEESPVHELLDTAHSYGFYSTGLHAGRIALAAQERRAHDSASSDRIKKLADLAKVVTGRIRPKLETSPQDFTMLFMFLDENETLHDRISAEL
jgi:hypothetical protein